MGEEQKKHPGFGTCCRAPASPVGCASLMLPSCCTRIYPRMGTAAVPGSGTPLGQAVTKPRDVLSAGRLRRLLSSPLKEQPVSISAHLEDVGTPAGEGPPTPLCAGRVPAALPFLLQEGFPPLCAFVQPPPTVTLFQSDVSTFLVGRGGSKRLKLQQVPAQPFPGIPWVPQPMPPAGPGTERIPGTGQGRQ